MMRNFNSVSRKALSQTTDKQYFTYLYNQGLLDFKGLRTQSGFLQKPSLLDHFRCQSHLHHCFFLSVYLSLKSVQMRYGSQVVIPVFPLQRKL